MHPQSRWTKALLQNLAYIWLRQGATARSPHKEPCAAADCMSRFCAIQLCSGLQLSEIFLQLLAQIPFLIKHAQCLFTQPSWFALMSLSVMCRETSCSSTDSAVSTISSLNQMLIAPEGTLALVSTGAASHGNDGSYIHGFAFTLSFWLQSFATLCNK